MTEPEEILTTDEVCALLKMKKGTLYKITSEGTGPPYYKIGRTNRWKRRRSWPGSTRTWTSCREDVRRTLQVQRLHESLQLCGPCRCRA